MHLGLSRRSEPGMQAITQELQAETEVLPDVLAIQVLNAIVLTFHAMVQETERASWHHGAIDVPRFMATILGYRYEPCSNRSLLRSEIVTFITGGSRG